MCRGSLAARQYKTNELRQLQTRWLCLPLQFLMGFSDVSEYSLLGVCQPHFTAAFMLLVLTATQFKWTLGLKSCLFAYLCLFILFVSVHYREIFLFIKPLWIPQQTCKHNAKWINWEILVSEACLNRCSWINQLCIPTITVWVPPRHSVASAQVQWHVWYNSFFSGKVEGEKNIWSVRGS